MDYKLGNQKVLDRSSSKTSDSSDESSEWEYENAFHDDIGFQDNPRYDS